MPPATQSNGLPSIGYPDDAAYPSRDIAFQAAGMITSIVENLQAHDELRFTPAFMLVIPFPFIPPSPQTYFYLMGSSASTPSFPP